jgi:predicted nicotinamide N-methyase
VTEPRDDAARRALIRAHTTLAAPALVPELRLHLATEVTPLWRATQALLDDAGMPPPFWAFAWPGGQALARFLLDDATPVARREVFALAAGSGVDAIAAARAGAARVVAADVDPFARSAIALNALANRVAVEVVDGDPLDGEPPAVDVILAGDVCYDQRMAPLVIAWLRRAAAAGTEVLIADPGRAYFPDAGIERLGWHRVPTSRELEDGDSRETVIARLLPCS